MQVSHESYSTPASSSFMIPELTSTKISSINENDPRNLIKVSVTPTPLTMPNSNEGVLFSNSDFSFNDKTINHHSNGMNSILTHATLQPYCNNSSSIDSSLNSINSQSKLAPTTIPITLPSVSINSDNSNNSSSNSYSDYPSIVTYNNSFNYNFNENYSSYSNDMSNSIIPSQDSSMNNGNYYLPLKTNSTFFPNSNIFNSEQSSHYSNQWTPVLQVGIKRGHWTHEEDQLIINAMREVTEGGELKWSEISKRLKGLRSGKQCRERWANHLRPSLRKGKWSPREDNLLLQAQARLGNAWTRIALEIPGRSENEVKNRWYSTIVRRNLHLKKTTETVGNISSTPPVANTEENDEESLPEEEHIKKKIKLDKSSNNTFKFVTNSTSLLSYFKTSKEFINIIKELSSLYTHLNLPTKSEKKNTVLNISRILYEEDFSKKSPNIGSNNLNINSTNSTNSTTTNSNNSNNNNNNNSNSNNSSNSSSNNINSNNVDGSLNNVSKNHQDDQDDEKPNDFCDKQKQMIEKLSDEEILYIKLAEIYLESIKNPSTFSNTPFFSISDSFNNSVFNVPNSSQSNSAPMNTSISKKTAPANSNEPKNKQVNSSAKLANCSSPVKESNINKHNNSSHPPSATNMSENFKNNTFEPITSQDSNIKSINNQVSKDSCLNSSKDDLSKSFKLDQIESIQSKNSANLTLQSSVTTSVLTTETEEENEFDFQSKPSTPIHKPSSSSSMSPVSNSTLIDYDLSFLHEAQKISIYNNSFYSENENFSFFNSLNNFMCSSGLTSPLDTPLVSRSSSPAMNQTTTSSEDKGANKLLFNTSLPSDLPNILNENGGPSLQSSSMNISPNNSTHTSSYMINYFQNPFQDFFENYLENNQEDESY